MRLKRYLVTLLSLVSLGNGLQFKLPNLSNKFDRMSNKMIDNFEAQLLYTQMEKPTDAQEFLDTYNQIIHVRDLFKRVRAVYDKNLMPLVALTTLLQLKSQQIWNGEKWYTSWHRLHMDLMSFENALAHACLLNPFDIKSLQQNQGIITKLASQRPNQYTIEQLVLEFERYLYVRQQAVVPKHPEIQEWLTVGSITFILFATATDVCAVTDTIICLPLLATGGLAFIVWMLLIFGDLFQILK